ncbi:hypothetical protein KKE45_00240 [Patescibacteria group bacterium]|nr:hypothetical protein [Patescibacteria group bacterium]
MTRKPPARERTVPCGVANIAIVKLTHTDGPGIRKGYPVRHSWQCTDQCPIYSLAPTIKADQPARGPRYPRLGTIPTGSSTGKHGVVSCRSFDWRHR